MASSDRHPVSVKATFSIEGDSSATQTMRTFDGSNCEPAVLGLPEGKTPGKPEAGDYSYSGMHDHGPLPAPREGGDIALLIACVEKAKQCSDEFLTNVIKKENISRPHSAGNSQKRSKTDISP